jgi:antitoxin HicB
MLEKRAALGNTMRYPVDLAPDGNGFMASFPDVPEALSSGATEAEALEMAKDALETAMEFYFEDKRPLPVPGKVKRGQHAVELPASITGGTSLQMPGQQLRGSRQCGK